MAPACNGRSSAVDKRRANLPYNVRSNYRVLALEANMRIGELSKRTSCDIETIRYYEKSGLLAEPGRNSSGYREYAAEHLERLQFIRHCRSLQLSLAEIRVLLDLQTNPSSGCQEVDQLLDGHIAQVREQMAALRILEEQLVTLRKQCQGPHSVEECGILQNLNEAVESQECACHEPEVKV
jgi:Cd(II)/Pb(II)-responsive transcriptional regulator